MNTKNTMNKLHREKNMTTIAEKPNVNREKLPRFCRHETVWKVKRTRERRKKIKKFYFHISPHDTQQLTARIQFYHIVLLSIYQINIHIGKKACHSTREMERIIKVPFMY